jgi:AGZA family xanthine/uracil permease-like MFS transporter
MNFTTITPNRLFGVSKHGSTIRTEIRAGLTTFLAMAYIIVVNPAILEKAGISRDPGTIATIAAAVFGCLAMGFYANRPFAVAPYMGENAFLAFSLVPLGVTWQECLGCVFVSGVAFLVLTLLGLRRWLVNAISRSMKHSFAVGIGLFLLLIGLYEIGIVESFVQGLPAQVLPQVDGKLGRPDVPLKIGNLHDPKVLLGIGGFMLIAALMAWRVAGAILIGIVATGAIGIGLGFSQPPQGIVAVPWSAKYNLGEIALQLDVVAVLQVSFWPILLTLFLMSFLDTLGTLVAVGDAGRLLDADGNLPQIERPMVVDSLACIFSGLIGTSTSGAFIESATGIREGGRTGLTAVTTGLLFATALFFLPLLQPLQGLAFAYGPALMAVGVLMLGSVRNIDFEDMTEAVPAVATIAMMLFSYNIANGLTAGLVLYPIFKLLAGKWRQLHSGSVVLGLLCLAYYVFGVVH